MYGQLEVRLEQLPGVISAKIVSEEAKIKEIHILANDQQDISAILEDIKTILLIKQEQSVPEEKISIAQVETELEVEEKNRIEIISIYKEKEEPICHIKLEVNDQVVEEEIRGEDTAVSTLVARAMLEIIEKHIEFTGELELNNVFITGENNDIMVVEVILHKWGEFHRRFNLIGAAYINLNLPLASGKACLKCLNRQLSIYL